MVVNVTITSQANYFVRGHGSSVSSLLAYAISIEFLAIASMSQELLSSVVGESSPFSSSINPDLPSLHERLQCSQSGDEYLYSTRQGAEFTTWWHKTNWYLKNAGRSKADSENTLG
jgi:hypothetical protein